MDSNENAGVSCTLGDSGTGELWDDRELPGGSSKVDVLGKEALLGTARVIDTVLVFK